MKNVKLNAIKSNEQIIRQINRDKIKVNSYQGGKSKIAKQAQVMLPKKFIDNERK